MKPDIAKKWVEALRSGNYQQTTHRLCSADANDRPRGFCCLGVLCDLAEQEGIIQHTLVDAVCVDGSYTRRYFNDNRAAQGSLPEDVRVWAGLQNNTGYIPRPRDGDPGPELTAMNDKGMSFDKIANFIEQNVGDL